MPTSARTRKRSGSAMSSIRLPLTRIVPASGRTSPRMSFRIVDFPEPLAPNRNRIPPLGRLKLMS